MWISFHGNVVECCQCINPKYLKQMINLLQLGGDVFIHFLLYFMFSLYTFYNFNFMKGQDVRWSILIGKVI